MAGVDDWPELGLFVNLLEALQIAGFFFGKIDEFLDNFNPNLFLNKPTIYKIWPFNVKPGRKRMCNSGYQNR
jgi:hypothetical protein